MSLPYVFWVADSEFFTFHQNFLPNIPQFFEKYGATNEYFHNYTLFHIEVE